jgi:hypothetical protein
VYRERQERAISRLPNPLEFFAFAFCFTSFFAGPAFDFKEYMSSVEEAPFREAPPAGSKGAAGSTDLHWGSRLKAAGGKLLLSLVFLGVNVTLGSRFNFNDVLGSSSELSLARQPMLLRIGIAWLCLLVTRSKYYFAWTISEGSSNLAGFGYQPSKGSWSGVRSIDVLGFELAPSVSASTRAWNMQTQSWLERYAHKRVPRSVNLWVTYALSAFWHGECAASCRPQRQAVRCGLERGTVIRSAVPVEAVVRLWRLCEQRSTARQRVLQQPGRIRSRPSLADVCAGYMCCRRNRCGRPEPAASCSAAPPGAATRNCSHAPCLLLLPSLPLPPQASTPATTSPSRRHPSPPLWRRS